MPLPEPDFHTTTANALDGYVITQQLGVVRGITVRSRSVFGVIGASLQVLRGGEIGLFVELWDPLESTCRHASLSIL